MGLDVKLDSNLRTTLMSKIPDMGDQHFFFENLVFSRSGYSISAPLGCEDF